MDQVLKKYFPKFSSLRVAVIGDFIADEFIYHLRTDQPLHQTLEAKFNLEVMAILDAGIRSAGSGRLESVNNGTWQIG